MTQKTFNPGSKGMQLQYITKLAAGLLALLLFSSCTMEKSVTVVDDSRVPKLEKIEKKIQELEEELRKNKKAFEIVKTNIIQIEGSIRTLMSLAKEEGEQNGNPSI